jgi:hypothetical protein
MFYEICACTTMVESKRSNIDVLEEFLMITLMKQTSASLIKLFLLHSKLACLSRPIIYSLTKYLR